MSQSKDFWRAGAGRGHKAKPFKCLTCPQRFSSVFEANNHACPFTTPLGSTAPFPHTCEGTLHCAGRGAVNSPKKNKKGGTP